MKKKTTKNVIAQRILRDVPKNHFTPRSYEWELLHTALSRDTILCCGNEEAKAFITLCFFKERLYQLGSKFKYSVYVNDQTSVVERIASRIRHQLLVPVFSLADKSALLRWKENSDRARSVLCITSACLKTLLFDLGVVHLSEFNTLIIDHCHALLKDPNHPYAAVMEEYGREKDRDAAVPHLLAFTDALYDLKSNDPRQMEQRLSDLERLLYCQAETASELLNVFVYGVRPREEVLEYELYNRSTPITCYMQERLETVLEFLEDIDGELVFINRSGVQVDALHYVTRAVRECLSTLRELGPFCCNTVSRVFMKHLLASEFQCNDEVVKRVLRFVITEFGLITRVFRIFYDNILTLDEFMELIPPKVMLLVQQLKSYHPRVQFTIEVDESTPVDSQDSDIDSDLDLGDDGEEEEPHRRMTRGRGSRRRRGSNRPRSASRSSVGSRASAQFNYRAILNEDSIEPEDDRFCSLVLVSSQFMAYTLSRLIDELCIWDAELYYVKPGHFFGPSKHQLQAMSRKTDDADEEDEEDEDGDEEGEESERKKTADGEGRSSLLNRQQEETIRKFRMGHVNVLFATGLTGSTAEENNFCLQLDIPKCNLLLRFGPPPTSFVDYVYCKTRVKSERASYVFLVESGEQAKLFQQQYNLYRAVESVLVQRCASRDSFDHASAVDGCHAGAKEAPAGGVGGSDASLPTFQVPVEGGATLFMSGAIGLVNEYCASLPSDVYSQLVPTWWLAREADGLRCHLKLPMNSPMNWEVVGDLMPTPLLAKMAAALRCCGQLYLAGELTNDLEPVGKEKQLQDLLRPRIAAWEAKRKEKEETANWIEKGMEGDVKDDDAELKKFHLNGQGMEESYLDEPKIRLETSELETILTEEGNEMKATEAENEEEDETEESKEGQDGPLLDAEEEANEGLVSVKRRQFYYKKIADCLQNCLPISGVPLHLYLLHLRLSVPLPTEATRIFRELFHPELASKCFGLLTKRPLRSVPQFPVFTRSGEVAVNLRHVTSDLVLTAEQLARLVELHRLLFRRVMRLEKDAVMTFACERAYSQELVVPLETDSNLNAWIDWDFVAEVEAAEALSTPCKIPPRRLPSTDVFDFREEDYADAIVMPTYRNFDQPQHYYVAEIRKDLTPKCTFPSDVFHTFEDYYCRKYNAVVTNPKQPLLDVDCTVMRLNLLVPRHINYYGHILHQVSDESRRLRSESLHQKQLLLPELTYRHPFPASLWRKAVCLPTILYRINYLLLADEIRRRVAIEANVGKAEVDPDVNFEPMTFRFSTFNASSSSVNGASGGPPLETARLGDKSLSAEGWSLADVLNESKLITEAEVEERRAAIEATRLAPDDDFGEFVAKTQEEEEELQADSAVIEEDVPDPDSRLNEEEIVASDVEDDESVDSFEGDVTFFRDPEDLPAGSEYGPSPVALLEALTMSNSNDFFNYERLETLGDSFLKFAVTVFYFCSSGAVHEGQLSRLRSRQVSNFNLYRLGKLRGLHEVMVGYKFEPAENWIPPGYVVLYDARFHDQEQALQVVPKVSSEGDGSPEKKVRFGPAPPKGVPYYLRIQHSLSDKSVADCLEALVGCYLTSCGEIGALRVVKWLGLEVGSQGRDPTTGELLRFWWPKAPTPLLQPSALATPQLEAALWGYDEFEQIIQYKFQDRAYLLQAFTHASYTDNTLTDCYQKLEFLGDAVLDYVVTRYLFEDSKNHSPGVLTDLRSALVNNHIFAGLAVKWGFHKFFRCFSPTLWNLIERFVEYQKVAQADDLDFITSETELFSGEDDREDVEIPKALGDIFESVAGAVFLDSGNCLDTVWRVFYRLMRERIDRYTACIPKSPVRELLEMYPEATSFERPKRTSRGKIFVCVRVVNRGRFYGIGRNYRIAKSAAARRALCVLKAAAAAREAAAMPSGPTEGETSD